MDSKIFFSLFLVFSSWAIVGFSQNHDGDDLSQLGDLVSKDLSQGLGSLLQETGGGADPVGSIPCIQKLLPCQPYLHSPKPPATCCFPLKVMVSNDSECLCTVFNNPVVLKYLNLTQDEALKLPHACGANADISLCKNVTASPPISPVVDPSTAAAPAPAAASPAEGSSNSSSNSPPKSAAYGISHFGGSGFIAFFIALFVSAFQA